VGAAPILSIEAMGAGRRVMFIDYVPLLLLNMSAGFLILAFYLIRGIEREDRAKWAPAFGIAGLVAFLAGLHMIFTWPLPSVYNIAFGEMSVLLGASYLGICWSVRKGWSPAVVGIYSALAGLAAGLLGVRMLMLGQTARPLFTCVGFCLSGLGAVLFGLAARAGAARALRVLTGVVLIAAALMWAYIAGLGYWGHMSGMTGWKPATQIERQVTQP
jgi:putative membrane protein